MLQRKFYNPKLFSLCLFVMFFLLLATIAYAEDLQAPSLLNITIEDNAIYTSGAGVSILITAQDDTGVTGYFLSETFSVPEVESFTPVASTTKLSQTVAFTLSSSDSFKTVYAWFKDAAGNISSASAGTITLDENSPNNAKILINNESGSVSNSQVSLKLSAEDTLGIVGYYVSEYSETPLADQFHEIDSTTVLVDLNVSFSLTFMPGMKTLYAWFIDAAGNISSPISSSVNFTYGMFTVFGSDAYEEANGIATDSSGNTYIVGSTQGDLEGNENPSIIDYSAFLTKLSNTGEILWTKLVGTTHSTRGNKIAVDSSGNIFIGGTYDESFNMTDAFVAKFDTNGTQKWLKIYMYTYTDSVERISGLDTDSNGNVYITGSTNETLEINDTTTIDFPSGDFLAKYDTNGTNLWGREIFANTAGAQVYDMAVSDSGDIVITGHAINGLDGTPGLGVWDFFIAKFDTLGDPQWTKVFGTPYDDLGFDLALDSSGTIYVSGTTKGNLDTGTDTGEKGYNQGFIGKFNSLGEKQWIKRLPSVGHAVWVSGITLDNKGGVYTTGDQNNTEDINDSSIFVYKYNTIGDLTWTKLFPATLVGAPGDITMGPGDLLYTTGRIYNGFAGQQYFGSSDVFVWKSTTDSLLDTTLPTGTITINNDDSLTYSQTVTLNLLASDNIGIAGYYISENISHPSPSDFSYLSETMNFETDIEYTFESETKESKTIYVWYCDAFGNFSLPVQADISFSADNIDPVPDTLTINGGDDSTKSTQLTLAFTATDNFAVTGYYISEEYADPLPADFVSVPATASFEETLSYTIKDTSPGTIYINIWFRDAEGNINSWETRANATIKLEDTTPPTTIVSPPAGIYDTPQTVTLTCEDDYYCLSTKYFIVNETEIEISYTEPFEITPPAILLVQSKDFNNFETTQMVTYSLGKTISDAVQAGEVKSSPFEVVEGLTLNINFNLEQNSIPRSIQSIDCSTPVALKSPDGETYASYEYTGSTLNILVAHPAQGTWTLEIDRSSCSASATYEAIAHQVPDYGNLPGSVSSKDVVKYLQVITGSQPLGIDANNDVNNDKRIGPTEAISLLQRFSNLR